ncbi:UNVERIFIED_CONTAM: hypothetical protein GTU68_038847 [Idotea baltica]|nr:hypothetical protein [Idotea baltica]
MFWHSHNPIGARRGNQYMIAIWYGDDTQLDVINATKESVQQRLEKEPTAQILPLEVFYNAEDYHQKYSLQRHENAMSKFNAVYPEFQGFIDSTAAARLNGLSYGHGTQTLLNDEGESYGLSTSDLKAIYRG